ncbi:hypothetical protein BBJ28_00010102 [Nothophytophthora sp. Chile5]|nr:hypothetical protein BBJ28_00010102 [Nothophytophthora sp. Chile5]
MVGEHEVVRVSAPGKLLLLGEHAVVYGCPVVAAVLSDLRIKAEIVRGSLLCFMVLYPSNESTDDRVGRGGLSVEVSTSNLPIGAGLGSSAALSVALSGAFAELSGSPRKHELDYINAYAYAAEVILHGSPSGADNTVSCFGGTLVFQKLPKPSFRRISCELNDFRFLLVNTRVPRSTKVQVGNVRKKYDTDRAKVQQQFDSIQQIVEEFVTLSEQKLLSEEVLAREIGKNQEILNSLGVGHPQIDEVERKCKQFGGATKLTGAGGGGCTISILPRSMSDGDMQTLVGELEAKGFDCFISSIGGPGLIRA